MILYEDSLEMHVDAEIEEDVVDKVFYLPKLVGEDRIET